MDPSLHSVHISTFPTRTALLRIPNLLHHTPMRSQTCRHCGAPVQYPEGTPQKQVDILLDNHLEVCHSLARRTRPPLSLEITSSYRTEDDEPYDTDTAVTLVSGSAETSPSMSTAGTLPLPDETTTNQISPIIEPTISTKKPRKKAGRRLMTEDSRRINLEDDIYTSLVTPKSVKCTACLREISLDKRWNYYAYPWEKHRRTCLRIKFAEEERLRRVAVRNEAFSEMELFTPDVRNPDGPSIIKGEEPDHFADSQRPAKRPSPNLDDLPLSLCRHAKRLKDCDI